MPLRDSGYYSKLSCNDGNLINHIWVIASNCKERGKMYTVYWESFCESFTKENFCDMSIVSDRERMFTNLVIHLRFLVINKK